MEEGECDEETPNAAVVLGGVSHFSGGRSLPNIIDHRQRVGILCVDLIQTCGSL